METYQSYDYSRMDLNSDTFPVLFICVRIIIGVILCNYYFRIYFLEVLDTILVLANIPLNFVSRQLQLAPAGIRLETFKLSTHSQTPKEVGHLGFTDAVF